MQPMSATTNKLISSAMLYSIHNYTWASQIKLHFFTTSQTACFILGFIEWKRSRDSPNIKFKSKVIGYWKGAISVKSETMWVSRAGTLNRGEQLERLGSTGLN
jgi:hypothetical protein